MDLATAQAKLDTWLDAEAAVAVGKAYTIGNRQLTRSDASEVRSMITYWQRVVNTMTSNSYSVKNPGIKVATWS